MRISISSSEHELFYRDVLPGLRGAHNQSRLCVRSPDAQAALPLGPVIQQTQWA